MALPAGCVELLRSAAQQACSRLPLACDVCWLAALPLVQCRLIGGRLVNMSVDVYIAMELADGGDLFHLRGQMSGALRTPRASLGARERQPASRHQRGALAALATLLAVPASPVRACSVCLQATRSSL